MPFTLRMPKLSPTMESGMVAKWHKREGEFVEAGALLLEVATDKATIEHHALDEGWLRTIFIKEGEEGAVNDPLALFSAGKEDALTEELARLQAEAEQKRAQQAAEEIKEKERPAPEETTSAALSGQQLRDRQPEAQFAPEKPYEEYQFPYPTSSTDERIAVSPLARKEAADRHLDLSSVVGSGPHGRIVSEDLLLAEKKLPFPRVGRERPQTAAGSYQEESLTPMRRAIGDRLLDAKRSIPHFYVEMEIDAAPLMALRQQLAAIQKCSVNDFLLRGVAMALSSHPEVNSGYNSRDRRIIRFTSVDLAVAVSTAGGLITPILWQANYKSVGQLSAELRDLAERARSGKLDPREYRGGSFTLSSLGMYGVSRFQAIVNPPQAAILAVGKVVELPVVENGTIAIGQRLALTLSADHRVIDGAVAAQFLATLKQLLEQPAQLLL